MYTADDYVRHVLGTAGNPMRREYVTSKGRGLIEPVPGKAKATRLIDQLSNPHNVADVCMLRSSLQPG